MHSLKQIILKKLTNLSIVVVILILCSTVVLQAMLVQNQVRDNAQATFVQISQIVAENQSELNDIEAEYRETCLLNAETIAYIIQHHPEILGNVEEFRQLAVMMEVDEIHIFDDTGRIFTGTHPEYYNYTFDSGEQMNFFKPMLMDKGLQLCQDITPNTAEGKLVQYSALWSANEQFIVQVGMYPDAVLAVTEKNELSHIFSLLQGQPGVDLFAIDAMSGKIIGTTNSKYSNMHLTDIGLTSASINKCKTGAHIKVDGVDSFAVFTDTNRILFGYVVSNDTLYHNIPVHTSAFALGLILIVLLLVVLIMRISNQYIIHRIHTTNDTLRAISEGDLHARIHEQSSQEFAELGQHINYMVDSLLAGTSKLNFVLTHTNMRIGVYEYNKMLKPLLFTGQIQEILRLSDEEVARLVSDSRRWQEYVDFLQQDPVSEEEKIFHVMGQPDLYIKLEEITKGNDVFGIIIDASAEMMTRKKIETERDYDLLLNMYNRRGLNVIFAKLFADVDAMGYGAMVMIDSDGLKYVNDTYGHRAGDAYLKRTADIIRNFGTARRVAGRMSGDEFVLLLYGYDSEAAVHHDLMKLTETQERSVITLADGVEIPVRFSIGYVMTKGREDYYTMVTEADGYMYANKQQRKLARTEAELK